MTAASPQVDPAQLERQFARHLHPNPTEDAYEITDVEGEIPRELFGTLYRNGPSQRQLPPEGASALHLFDGDGLVHAFSFEEGRVFQRTRYVRHESFLAEQAEGRFCMNSGNVAAASPIEMGRIQPNTNIVLHAGRLFALVENAPPFELDPKTLDPIGSFDFGGRLLGMSTSAHPKIDGATGQLLIHGYQPVAPFVSLYVVEPDGRTSLAESIDAPWPGMLHDMAISEDHVVLPLGPIVFDVNVLAEGGVFRDALRWEPERGLKFGIRSREPGSRVRWFDAPTPGYLFHPGNAYEEDGRIWMDACVYRDGDAFLSDLAGIRRGRLAGGFLAHPVLYEFDLASGSCREHPLSDEYAEFPRLDDRLVGYKNRWGYAATSRPDPVSDVDAIFSSITKYDRRGGHSVRHVLPHGSWTGEPVFVPRSGDAEEDDGFVLALTYDGRDDRSGLLVLDARRVDGKPLARLWLRHRVPLGFHGNFAPGVVQAS